MQRTDLKRMLCVSIIKRSFVLWNRFYSRNNKSQIGKRKKENDFNIMWMLCWQVSSHFWWWDFSSVCLAPFWRVCFSFLLFKKNQNGSNGSSLWTPTSAASSSVHHQPFILAPPPAGTASHGSNHHHNNSLGSGSNNTNGGTSTGSPMKVPVKPPPLKSLPVILNFST
jgi:hypothetical protein